MNTELQNRLLMAFVNLESAARVFEKATRVNLRGVTIEQPTSKAIQLRMDCIQKIIDEEFREIKLVMAP